jgi:hypothetical protein
MLDLASDAIMVYDLEHRVFIGNGVLSDCMAGTSVEACGARVDQLFHGDTGQFVNAYLAMLKRGTGVGK